MNATAINGRGLAAGQEVDMKILTRDGAVTLYTVTVPQSLDGEDSVSV